MNISEILTSIVTGYSGAKNEEFTEHPMGSFVRNTAVKAFKELVPRNLELKGSVGNSTWARVPWIAFLNPLETSSAQDGFYVVYLINPISKSVYLSLNQGVVTVEREFRNRAKQHEMLRTRANLLRQRASKLSKFASREIDLGKKGKLPTAYEAGHAFGYSYDLDDLKDNARLELDLKELLAQYEDLVIAGGYTIFPDEIGKPSKNKEEREQKLKEQKRRRLHESFERVGLNTKKVKDKKGYVCETCEFDFVKAYGVLGTEFIEAHHLIPFAELEENASRELDIKKDFAVLCANCHRMIHRLDDPADLDELREILRQQRLVSE